MKTVVFRLFVSIVALAFFTQASPAHAEQIATHTPNVLQIGNQPTDQAGTKTNAGVQVSACSTITDVPEAECLALVTLYTSTNGDSWTDHTGWLTGTTVEDWFGIGVWQGHVVHIFLENNNLTGSLPAGLDALIGLSMLVLTNNHLTDVIPSDLGNISTLYWLKLSNNQLSGSIPPKLGSLSNLGELQLQVNQLTGTIPTQLGGLANLEFLWLGSNQLSGEIPASLGDLGKLRLLHLASNNLTGEIPPELGNLPMITQLMLQDNQLSGNIPSQLGGLSTLTLMWLYDNPLTGPIPMSFTGLVNLTNFHALNTSVCEPPEAKFQTWKATVDDWWGSGLTCQVNLYLPCVMR